MRLSLRTVFIFAAALGVTVVLVQIYGTFCRQNQCPECSNTPVESASHASDKSMLQTTQSADVDYEALFELRRRHAHRACRARNRTGFESFQDIPLAPYRDEPYRWIFADDIHKIIYCSIPKAASTSWRRLFAFVTNSTNATSANSLAHEYVQRDGSEIRDWPHFKSIWMFSRKEATRRLKTYKKMIWVRDPYQRLVSAWRSKFFSVNPKYNRFGRTMMTRYRKNATEGEKKAGFPVTFKEFLTYVRDEGLAGTFDVHWNVMADFCFLCDIPYDYIGHYENLQPEASYLMKKLAGKDVPFPFKDRVRDSHRSLTKANYTAFNNEAGRQLLLDTLSLYHFDYDVFGYEWPKF